MATTVSADNNANSKWQAFTKKKAKLIADFQIKKSQQVALNKGTHNSNLFRDRKNSNNKIDVSAFNEVIEIDGDNMTVDVEGMTPFVKLVSTLAPKNYLPTVVPELKSITVGGALAGIGIESSSFRYGLVHETITEIEILTGSGEIVIATANNEHKNLFFAFPNSYGTLGYALRVRMQIINAAQFVKLEHHKFSDPNKYFMALEKSCHRNRSGNKIHYIEGIVFSKSKYVLSTATFCEKPAKPTSNYKFMRIYYKSLLRKKEDYLSVEDYIWRWDSDWFWCSKKFGMQNFLLRFLFGKWMLKSTSYNRVRRYLMRSPRLQKFISAISPRNEYIIQDVAVPVSRAREFLKFFQENIKINPVWNCPTRSPNESARYTMFDVNPQTLYINFGFWDKVKSDKPAGHYNRLIEQKVTELGGHKSLYSESFYSQDEFWNIYDQTKYNKLKTKYDPNKILRDIYSKCTEQA